MNLFKNQVVKKSDLPFEEKLSNIWVNSTQSSYRDTHGRNLRATARTGPRPGSMDTISNKELQIDIVKCFERECKPSVM